jgi:parallel beta-helix repeat protein
MKSKNTNIQFSIHNFSFLKSTLVLLALLSFNIASKANNYYFSSSTGNDSYTSTQAQNQATPWKSIAKLNSFFSSIVAGDNIYFMRGETFYGTIVVNKSGTSGYPIFIGAYGSGAKPVITGFTTISGWTNEGGGIYSKVISSAVQTNMVTIDGVQYAMGRYPDATYLSYESFSTNTSITDNTLGSATNWTGAEAVIRKNDWTIDRCLITNHSGNTLTYTSKGSTQNATANFGYFIQNNLRTLTTYGEWYHNSSTGKFYMYFGSISPTSKSVKLATLNYLISNSIYDNITVDNINFTGSINNAVNFSNGNDYCNIQNCDISFSGNDGVNFLTGTSSSVNNNNIKYCNGNGVTSYATATNITNNTISNIGNIPGQILGQGGYNGIYTPGNGVIVRYNTIKNTGYNGIILRYSGSATIQYNFIETVCTILDDGAGIYMSSPNVSARLIDHNIIQNVIGGNDGTPNNYPLSNGIFLDETTTNTTVTNNTVGNILSSGIKLLKANNNTITDNTTFNCARGIEFLDGTTSSVANNRLKRNIFFAKTASQYSLVFYTSSDNITSFGTADSNYYVRPIDDNITFYLRQPSTGYLYKNLAGWQTFTGQDTHSKKSLKSITDINQLNFQYNASSSPKVVAFSGLSYIDAKGITYNNSATIPAWSSIVLIANGLATASTLTTNLLPAVNPAYTVNGLDYKYYEGSWSALPSFSTLTPVKTGTVSNFDLTPANRSDQYGFNFSGFINVPADGVYTFYTSSDDGSSLYIDNVLTVNNDGLHGTTEKSGSIGLKAGKHAISGLFFQQAGGAVFQVSYSGNGISKQVIPASSLYRVQPVTTSSVSLLPAVNPSNTVNGLAYKYYEGSWTVLPNFSTLVPVKIGTVSNFDLTLANRSSQYGFNFFGYINVPADGVYTFYTSSDDGSSLYIDNVLTVSNDGIHATTEKSGNIGLKAGKHAIAGLFFQQAGGAVFQVSYSGNGISKQTIPASVLYRINSATGARTLNGNSLSSATTLNVENTSNVLNTLKISSFPNPTTTEFGLFVEGGSNEKIQISVIDAGGRIVFQTTGTTNKTYKFGNGFMSGIYIIKVLQGNNIQTLKVIKI